ncbi:hypothetical protein [Streptomyces sp. SID5643]|uniref:hypothetical protein n=1 Tax=Streptomyces sp. SID5643 TaxID=2690307 RepID=UPI0013696714|nr:hypothetical protein [Streptomyces sp. SID5643]MZF84701.1 hypothetical protein [Streptomyces sp. SID5643]
MSRHQQQLASALDALDRAFASEEPFPVAGCTYCYGDEGLAELSGPLDLISDDLLCAVAAKVPSHWDDFPRLYRRLTPRIIRSAVTGRLHVDENIIGSRLAEAEWTTWDAPLAGALHDVWAAWWRATLDSRPGPVSVRDTLSLITVATGALRPWLDIWTATRTDAADAQLAHFIDDVLVEYEITELHMGCYDEYDASAELLSWLLTEVRGRADDARLDEPYLLSHLRPGTDTPQEIGEG